MNNTIDFLCISSKIPSYLFILAHLTTPGDVIYLNCPGGKRDFITSMLAQIGLSAHPCMHYTKDNMQELINLSVFEDLEEIRQHKSNHTTEILLLPYQFPVQQFEHCAIDILSQNPNAIIIDELQYAVASKNFAVALSKEGYLYARLKQLKQKNRFNLI